jgi:polyisoprenoid-binding protein YceI
MRKWCASVFVTLAGAALCSAQVPVIKILTEESEVLFKVKASVNLEGHFDKWQSTLKFTSSKASSGRLEIRIKAATVDTGNGLKNKTLKSDDFFAVDKHPEITFVSSKVTPLGDNKFKLDGQFTIRGVSKPETLTLTVIPPAAGAQGEVLTTLHGTMAFDRKDFGMDKGIPFVKIADRVEVTVDLKGRRMSGPPVLPE